MNSPERPQGNPAPFDPAAQTYDTVFSETTLARWLRALVRAQIANIFRPGDQVLELGCGTGEDAVWLAQRGVRVIATDGAEEMLKVTRLKVEREGVGEMVRVESLDLNDQLSIVNDQWLTDPDHSSRITPHASLSGVFSNFGPLNCLAERKTLAGRLAKIVPPGGKVVLVIMGPICAWEMGWHLAHFQARTAFRRFRAGIPAHTGGGGTVRVWYPSPSRVRAEFAPHFRQVKLVGIGAFLPPSYLSHLVDRWPRVFARARAWEVRWGHRFPWNWVNDHYLIVLEKLA